MLLPPQTVAHTRGQLQAALDLVRGPVAQHGLRDLVVAIERSGEYHRPVQRACQQRGYDTRLVHPLTSKQFRQPADPSNKTDDTDLAAIFRAAVNGFGLVEPTLPEDYPCLQLTALERRGAHYLTRTPYVLLLVIPGVNAVSAADLVGEMGPITNYPNANAITGRAGLMPSRYQSDSVDRADGPLPRRANRRLRAAWLRAADNLLSCNHYFHAKAAAYQAQGKDPRWLRVKIAKHFSRVL